MSLLQPSSSGRNVPGWNLPCRQVQWSCCFLILCLCLLPEGWVVLPGYGCNLGLVLTFLTAGKIRAKTADTKLCLPISCLRQTARRNLWESVIVSEQASRNRVSSYCNPIQYLAALGGLSEERGYPWYGDCRTCFCGRLSRFRFGGLFPLLKRGEKSQGGKRPFLLMSSGTPCSEVISWASGWCSSAVHLQDLPSVSERWFWALHVHQGGETGLKNSF